MFNKYTKKQSLKASKGFSLIEMAVVLGIVGVIAVGSVGVFSEKRTHTLWQEGDARLALVKSSLLNFVKTNKYMPCPDSNGNGLENRTGDACTVHTGEVPFLTLGLASSQVEDSWGNVFTYAVNQGATSATDIADCPDNSACFFNNTSPPMFDLTTLPVIGQSIANNMSGSSAGGTFKNLRVCNSVDCSSASSGADVDGDALIAVIVSHNENGHENTGLGDSETLNKSASNYYVQPGYSQTPFFDDLLVTISANELKDRYETEIVEMSNGGGGSAPVNPFENTSVPIAGGNGDNNRFATDIGVNIESGTIDFGAENAGKMVTLSFDAVITGGWEDADALNEGVDAEWSGGNIETQDQFVVGLNSNVDQQLYDIANGADDGRVDLQQGLEWMGVDNSTQGDQYYYYDENDDTDNTWYEYASYNVELDANGQLQVDFAVFSTHVSEMVEVDNIEAVMYNAPTSIPTLPFVGYVEGKKFNEIIEDGNLTL